MNLVICSIIFVIINVLGLRFVLSPKHYELVSDFSAEKKWSFSGQEVFILLTLLFAPIAAITYDMLALRLLFWLILLCIGIFWPRKTISLNVVAFFYLLYLLWLLISLCLSPQIGYGIRTFMKYLFPFLILLYVPSVIKNQFIFIKAIKYVYWIFTVVIVIYLLSIWGLNFLFTPLQGVFWWRPAIIDSLSVLTPVIFIVAAVHKNKRYLLLLLLMFLYPLVGFIVRTGLVAIAISLMAMIVFQYKHKALPIILIVLTLGMGTVIFVPQIRDKTFRGDLDPEEIIHHYQYLDVNDIDSSGRFALWDWLMNDYFYPNPVTGSGLGVQQSVLYQNSLTGSGLSVAHNDFVQILCDTGLIGMVLYGSILLVMIISSFIIYQNRRLSDYCRYAAFISGTSLCGMIGAMMFDNVVNYTMTTLVFPFTFYSIALSLKRLDSNVQRHHPAVQ